MIILSPDDFKVFDKLDEDTFQRLAVLFTGEREHYKEWCDGPYSWDVSDQAKVDEAAAICGDEIEFQVTYVGLPSDLDLEDGDLVTVPALDLLALISTAHHGCENEPEGRYDELTVRQRVVTDRYVRSHRPDLVEDNCWYCGVAIEADNLGAWLDPSDGDCCPGSTGGENENGVHTPEPNR